MNLESRFRISLKNLMICINLSLDLKEYKRRKRVEEERESDERGERKEKKKSYGNCVNIHGY